MEENKVLMEAVKICVQMCTSRTGQNCSTWQVAPTDPSYKRPRSLSHCHPVSHRTLTLNHLSSAKFLIHIFGKDRTLSKSGSDNVPDMLSISPGPDPLRGRYAKAR